jgi:hypothetical protein
MATIGGSNIVRNGLILELDAANRRSYVSGSTTWRDVSGDNLTGLLVNGPTFNSNSNGSIVFDGTNDYYSSSIAITQSGHTIMSWVYINSLNKEWIPILEFQSSNSSRAHYYVLGDLNGSVNQRRGFGANWTPNNTTTYATWTNPNLVTVEANRWYMFTGRLSGSVGDTYVNLEKSKATLSGISYSSILVNTLLNARPSSNFYNSCLVGTVLIYNTALSDTEIQQNYNAMKSRFNL